MRSLPWRQRSRRCGAHGERATRTSSACSTISCRTATASPSPGSCARTTGSTISRWWSSAQLGTGRTTSRAGVDGWLVKPARPSALYNALVDALARRGTGVARAAPVRRTKAPSARPRLAGRVLVAEDNVVNQKVIVALLEKLGCRADLASNGREAVDQIERFPYDLVLMDCEMPEMDGFAATAEIRRREAGTGRRVPIVALTAYAMTGDRERCLAAGMDEYLSKPVREPELTATLGAMLPMVPAPPEPVPTASALPAVPAAPILLGDLAGDPDLMREIVDLY